MEEYTKPWYGKWVHAMTVRAIKTFAQTMAASLGVDYVDFVSLNPAQILTLSALAALGSVLTSLAGLPEVKIDSTNVGNG